MANYSDWAAEKKNSERRLSAEDKHAIIVFLASTTAFVGGLLLIGRYLHYLY